MRQQQRNRRSRSLNEIEAFDRWGGALALALEALEGFGILVVDAHLQVKFGSQGMRTLLGLDPEAALRLRNLLNVLSQKHFKEIEKLLRAVWATHEPQEANFAARDHEFTGRQFRARLRILQPGEDPSERYILLTLTDITAQASEMRQVRELEERWSLALEGSEAGVWDWNIAEGTVEYSRQYKAMLGYEDHEFGRSFSDWSSRLHPEDVSRVLRITQECLAGKAPMHSTEFRMRCKNGKWKWIHARGWVVSRSKSGKALRMVGTHVDVSERKELQDRLVSSHELLQSLTQQAPGVLYQFLMRPDGTSCFPYASEAIRQIYAVSPEDVREDASILMNRIHPDDLEALNESVMRSARDLTPWSAEYRVILPEIGVRWTQGDARPQRLPDGSTLWHGYITDITERKLLEAHRERLGLIAKRTRNAVVITDTQGRIEWVNEAFTHLTEYSPDEVRGRTPGSFLQGPESDKEIAQQMRDAIKRCESINVEIVNYAKNGQKYIVRIEIEPLYQDGRHTGFMAIETDVSEERKLQSELERRAMTDKLTGLANRDAIIRLIQTAVNKEQKEQSARRRHFGILFLDFDRFKLINDSLGHEVGDKLLVAIGKRLHDSLRLRESSEGDVPTSIARLGGDEFVIFLDQLSKPGDAVLIAERLLERLAQPYRIDDHVLHSTASIGVVTSEVAANCAEDLLRDADTAMYEAKLAGKSCVRVFDESMHERVQARLELENDLRRAIDQSEIHVLFQPIVDLATGRPVKAETLVRWNHPQRGLISPDTFISIAEDTGFITLLGEQILELAVKEFAHLRQEIGDRAPRAISVNISRSQLLLEDLGTLVSKVLNKYDLPAHCLHLEITETAVIRDMAASLRTLRELKAIGVKLHLDDFGTGYSSLSCLQQFPIDILKIDRMFVKGLGSIPQSRFMVEVVIKLAHQLGIKVVAEGVETEAQSVLLRTLDCDYGQGFYFSHPIPIQELRDLCLDYGSYEQQAA